MKTKLISLFKTSIDDLTDDQLKIRILKRKRLSLLIYIVNGVIAAVLLFAGISGLYSIQGFPVDSQLNATSLLAMLLLHSGIIIAGLFAFRIGNVESMALDVRTENLELQLQLRELERKLEALQCS
jgi:hypothetical protein